MKNKIKNLFKILVVTAGCLMFASFSPSLDGRAVVVDDGVFPQGLFAKTVGYLPGDIISVTNIAGDATVDILVIGALDPSEGVAIMLSPEAAQAMGIEKGSNNIVKITKRSGQEERVYGNAVISKSASDFEDKDDGSFETIGAEENSEAFEEPEAEENMASEEFTEEETPAPEETAEPEAEETEEVFAEETEETFEEAESEETEAPEETETPETTAETEEEAPAEEAIESEEIAEEPLEEEPLEEENFEEEPAVEEETPVEEAPEEEEIAEETIPEEPAEEETLEEEAFEDEFLEEKPEEEQPQPEEKEYEAVDEEELPEHEDAPEEEEFVEEELEETPETEEEAVAPEEEEETEDAPAEEAFAADELDELPEEETPAEENPVEEEFTEEEPAAEETPVEEEAPVEEESLEEEYEAIVLVPADSNPPEAEEPEEDAVEDVVAEDVVAEDELEALEEENVYNLIPLESGSASGSEVGAAGAPVESVAEAVEVEPEAEFAPVVENSTSYDKYIVPSLKDLESGKYYIQIAVYASDENILEVINKYGTNYPITIVPMAGGNRKQILVGPVTMDEYKVVLERFKSYGFKDAFLRKVR